MINVSNEMVIVGKWLLIKLCGRVSICLINWGGWVIKLNILFNWLIIMVIVILLSRLVSIGCDNKLVNVLSLKWLVIRYYVFIISVIMIVSC